MSNKIKLIQGICLFLLILAICFCTYYFIRLRFVDESDIIDGMNETGLAVVFLITAGTLLLIYSILYGYVYIQSWRGKFIGKFHQYNMKLTGLLSIILIGIIIITRRLFFLISVGPIALILLLLFFSSWIYNKEININKLLSSK